MEEAHMRDFHCSDAGMKCDYVARGSSDPEIVEQATRHAEQVHGMRRTDELEQRVLGLIHDERSDAHRTSMGGAIP
jgi:predicted small metal-binding protein